MEFFSDTFVPAEVGDWWFRSQPCPACGSAELRPVANLGLSHWLCCRCGQCWTPANGHLQAVDPWTCGGCANRSRRACIELAQRNLGDVAVEPEE